MNRKEHLLVILSEECIEVSKEISKALRFGLDDVWKNNPTPSDNINKEMCDLLGIYFTLIDEGILQKPDESLISQKRDKIQKFLEYSKQKGTLTE